MPTFECSADFNAQNPIDTYMLAAWRRRGIEPANLCSDSVFVRRVYLDVIGTLPEPDDVLAFVADAPPDKRARLIDALLQREEFADYWALKWCDLLRVKAEFPINLWPNAVQAYHRWVHDAVRDGMPYDQFARQLLTSSGSNFRVPPVNFYRAVQGRDPAAIAAAVGLTFMGVRVDKWPEAQRAGMAAFFKRVAYKKTDEWKEEIVYCDFNSAEPLKAVFPDGVPVSIPPEKDPRAVFADWLIQPDNPWFTRNIANRVWSWLLGRGIIHEPDDIRPDNPPANPELLAYLQSELVAAHYDVRHLFRLILNSRTYQQSSIARTSDPQALAQFAFYPVRRLDAEVLIDALCWIGGAGEELPEHHPGAVHQHSAQPGGPSRWPTAASPARSSRCSAGPCATPAWSPNATTIPPTPSGCTCSTRRTSSGRSKTARCCASCSRPPRATAPRSSARPICCSCRVTRRRRRPRRRRTISRTAASARSRAPTTWPGR